MFNIIKGNVINKNVKPVVINPNKKRAEIEEVQNEEEHVSAPLSKEENITKTKNEKEYYQEYFEDTKERLNGELEDLEEQIRLKKEELAEIDTQIEEIMINASEEAGKVLEEAKVEAEANINDIKANAWEEGYREGEETGRSQILAQSEEIYNNASSLLMDVSNKRKEMLVEAKKEVIELAFTIAKKVIKKEVENKEVLFENIMEAMEKAPKSREIKIYINFEQYTLASELKEVLGKSFSALNIEIIEDSSIKPGGAVIETKLGRIDASIEGQLEAIYDNLEEV